jgi:hypothetical protein
MTCYYSEGSYGENKITLNFLEVGVWCVASALKIIRPVLFGEIIRSVNTDAIFLELKKQGKIYGSFKQSNATAHSVNYQRLS